MCTYNSALTLRNAIASLQVQSYKDWELIIIDNGSEDDTREILKYYEGQDTRVICRYYDYNVGWCKGISDCLKIASGEYMMFLAADDIVTYANTLQDIANEIEKQNKPDVVWTGCCYAELNAGRYKVLSEVLPEYKNFVPSGIDERLEQMIYIMQNVYYNSVMHYVNIDFLRKNNIDFFSPYYGDCSGMTEVMCKADNMIILNKAEYVLVLNTSQTSQAVIFDYNLVAQWESIRKTFQPILYNKEYSLYFKYIAERISKNMVTMLTNIMTGKKLRDIYMNPMEVDFADRFLKAEIWLSDVKFGEMLNFAGRSEYVNEILSTAAVVLYKKIVSVQTPVS